jgi:hypothetical protein
MASLNKGKNVGGTFTNGKGSDRKKLGDFSSVAKQKRLAKKLRNKKKAKKKK